MAIKESHRTGTKTTSKPSGLRQNCAIFVIHNKKYDIAVQNIEKCRKIWLLMSLMLFINSLIFVKITL